MNETTTIEPLIISDFSGTQRRFSDIPAIKKFADEEKKEWLWLQEIIQNDDNLCDLWQPFDHVYEQLNQCIQQNKYRQHNDNKLSGIVTEIKTMVDISNSEEFRFSRSPEAQFVFTLKDDKSPRIAVYALAFLNNYDVIIDTSEAYEGAYWGMQYKQNSKETIEVLQKKLESLTHDWIEKANDRRSQFHNLVEDINKH